MDILYLIRLHYDDFNQIYLRQPHLIRLILGMCVATCLSLFGFLGIQQHSTRMKDSNSMVLRNSSTLASNDGKRGMRIFVVDGSSKCALI